MRNTIECLILNDIHKETFLVKWFRRKASLRGKLNGNTLVLAN